MKRQSSKEENVALQIAKILSPVDLDLDKVGFFIANLRPAVHYNRLVLLTEAAVEEQDFQQAEPDHNRYNQPTLF